MTERRQARASIPLDGLMSEESFYKLRDMHLHKPIPLKNGETGEEIGESLIIDITRRPVGGGQVSVDGVPLYEVILEVETEIPEWSAAGTHTRTSLPSSATGRKGCTSSAPDGTS